AERRGQLPDTACELRESCKDFLTGGRAADMDAASLAIAVIGGGECGQVDGGFIDLGLVHEMVDELGSFTDTADQHACGQRVKGACVAGFEFADIGGSLDLSTDIHGAPSDGLINDQHATERFIGCNRGRVYCCRLRALRTHGASAAFTNQ